MRRSLLMLMVTGMLACTEETSGPADQSPVHPPMLDGTVRATVLGTPAGDGLTAIQILIEAKSLELGAYQGHFNFDASKMELEATSLPDGAYRFINTDAASDGTIRFAGFTVARLETSVVLELRFRHKGLVAPEDVSVEIEVVGTLGGEEVPRSSILPPLIIF